MRQAFAGLLWSKQYYEYDVARWSRSTASIPTWRGTRLRNSSWSHMVNADIISMPDKWEYPWYAAWDLVPTVALTSSIQISQEQLLPCGTALPAPQRADAGYEWNSAKSIRPCTRGPPGTSTTRADAPGAGDLVPRDVFQKLMRIHVVGEPQGPAGPQRLRRRFLGLDNIGVFDRSAPLPTGGRLEQADGTAWMEFYAQTMLQLAVELSCTTPCTSRCGEVLRAIPVDRQCHGSRRARGPTSGTRRTGSYDLMRRRPATRPA